MDNQSLTFTSEPATTPLMLTERHLRQWTELLAHLQNTQAQAHEVDVCQRQITQFRQGIGQLQGI